MRLFVALPVPEQVRAEVAEWVGAVSGLTDGVRWSAPEQWHLTLAFLGETPDDRLPDVVAAGATAMDGVEAATLRLRTGGRFDDRVLWVGLADSEPVRAMARSLREGLREAEIAFDDRPFRPHLTLARARSGRTVDLCPAAAALANVESSPWLADAVDLVRSRPGAGSGGAAAHEMVARWHLD